MNQTVKKKWVEALRSGKYIQTFGRLKNNSGCYCALGVLCDVIDPNAWVNNYGDNLWRGDNALPPSSLRSAIHLSINDACEVSIRNDNNRYNFEQIANWIENNL